MVRTNIQKSCRNMQTSGPSCELHDFPTDGSMPHYWQYERTPLRQWVARNMGYSDVESYERNLAYYERNNIRQRWRLVD